MEFAEIFESLVGAVADRVVEKLNGPKAPERVPLGRVTEHGAPSSRWVTSRARDGLIALHGPRGGRFVWASELEALLARTTIRRHGPAPGPSGAGLVADARSAVAALVAKQAGSK